MKNTPTTDIRYGIRKDYNLLSLPVMQHFWNVGDHKTIAFLEYHDVVEIGYCQSGHGTYFANNRFYAFSKGTIAFIRPNDPHVALSSASKCIWHFTFFSPGNFHLPNVFPKSYITNDKRLSNAYDAYLEELNKIGQTDTVSKTLEEQKIISLLSYLVYSFFDEVKELEYTQKNSREYTAVLPAINHIVQNLAKELSVVKLAELCGYTPDHFRKMFEKAVGTTPVAYINDLRLQQVKEMLVSSDKSVLEIAMDCGFFSISSLNRSFKEIYKISPTQYRKEHKNE